MKEVFTCNGFSGIDIKLVGELGSQAIRACSLYQEADSEFYGTFMFSWPETTFPLKHPVDSKFTQIWLRASADNGTKTAWAHISGVSDLELQENFLWNFKATDWTGWIVNAD